MSRQLAAPEVWSTLTLLATNKATSDRFGPRRPPSEPEVDLLGFTVFVSGLLGLALAAWGYQYWKKWRESATWCSPRALFRELCQAHGLDRRDCSFLQQVAQWHHLDDPVQLFLQPRWLGSEAMHMALHCEAEATRLHRRLFAKDPAEHSNSAAV